MATASSPLSFSADLDADGDRGPSIVKAAVTLMCLSIMAVGLRLWARRMVRVNLLCSDYVLLIGLVLTLGFSALEIAAVHFGLGKHILRNTIDNDVVLLKFLFAEDVLYSIALTCTKVSILLLYYTIFPVAPSPAFRLAGYIVASLCLAWGLSTLLVGIFSCTPISDYWDVLNSSPNCINQHHWYLGTSIANVLTDAMILALPVLSVCQLQLSWKQKISVSGLFLLGGTVLVASIVRLVFLVSMTSPDITWSYYDVAMWSMIEINVAVISACLPTFRPLALAAAPILQRVGLSLRSFVPGVSRRSQRKVYATALSSGSSNPRTNSSRGRQMARDGGRGSRGRHARQMGPLSALASFGSDHGPESLQGFQESLQGYPYCETKIGSEPVVKEGRKGPRNKTPDEEMAELVSIDGVRPTGEAGIIVQRDLVQEWNRTDCER